MLALFLRDCRLALRSGRDTGLALVFFLLLVLLTAIAIGPDPAQLQTLAPAIVWIGVLLSSLLSLDKIFRQDQHDGVLEALLTSPLPPEGIALSKACAHWATTGLPLAVFSPATAYLLNFPLGSSHWLALSILIGTPALSLIGTFNAALMLRTGRGGLLLSILVLPMCIPTLIFGVHTVESFVASMSFDVAIVYLTGLTLLAVAVMPFATAIALRASIE